jgi:hypothetical protein
MERAEMSTHTKAPTAIEQVTEKIADVAPMRPIFIHQPEVKAYPPKIAKAILKITRELSPVVKAGQNSFHKYQYPKWEDVLEELGPKITDNGLIITMGEVSHGGFQEGRMMEATYEFTIINDDGDVWPDRPRITQMCKMIDNKGQIDDKAASKAHTQAHKYFLMQLFKIRTRDMGEADLDNDQPRAPTRRPVPNSTGKLVPHLIHIVEGESTNSWADRFTALFIKSESEVECSQWEAFNGDILAKLSTKNPDAYNAVIDAMADKIATFQKKATVIKPDPISSGLSDFPGDKPMTAIQRAPALTGDEVDWLHGLGGAFSGAEDLTDLAEHEEWLMKPFEDKFSKAAWDAAAELLQEHVERINEETKS